jgi:hypothetical protein
MLQEEYNMNRIFCQMFLLDTEGHLGYFVQLE